MIPHNVLKTKQRAERDGFAEEFGLRIHRSISWLGRAEKEAEDQDLRFILMWIAFNAAYAQERMSGSIGERDDFRAFFEKLVEGDSDQRIYQTIWNRYSQEIRLLLDNQYVFSPFWQYQNGVPGYENWATRFSAAKNRTARALTSRDTVTILETLFDRLYMLRNQMVHGGATWNSKVNRDQVRDSAAILSTLLPIFIDIMMDNHSVDWGPVHYPVVE